MSRATKYLILFTVQAGLFSATLVAQASCSSNPTGDCSSTVKNSCVNTCTTSCADIGECIFGCEIGGINNVDTCASSCTGLGTPCLDSCLQTVNCITLGCATNVTSYVSLNLGAAVYNRATGVWQQTIRITNTSGSTLTNLAFALDTLATGWTVTNADGMTSDCDSPYKNFSDLADGATATVTILLARVGTPVLTYSPRVIAGTSR